MNGTVWLKIAAKKKYSGWALGSVHASKTKPATEGNEIALRLTLEIPDAVFDEPNFEATLTLPKTTRQIPDSVEVANNIEAALKERFGLRIKVDMQPHDQAETA